jgi:hypothetical integral membrane protein (TIGR02206 family)
MQQHPFFAYNKDFTLLGTQHIGVMLLMVLLCIAVPFTANRYMQERQKLWLSRLMAVTISFWALIYVIIKLWLGDFDQRTDLPFDICNLTALLLPFLMWNPSYRVHEVLYFWILAGTVQGILTPHLVNGFPNFIFIKYWVIHAGLVVYAIYVTNVFDLRPNFRSIGKSFLILQAYVAFVIGINLMLGSNYVYVLGKPPTASALDYLGPWPWYLLVVEGLALVLFFLMWLPLRKRKAIPDQ